MGHIIWISIQSPPPQDPENSSKIPPKLYLFVGIESNIRMKNPYFFAHGKKNRTYVYMCTWIVLKTNMYEYDHYKMNNLVDNVAQVKIYSKIVRLMSQLL